MHAEDSSLPSRDQRLYFRSCVHVSYVNISCASFSTCDTYKLTDGEISIVQNLVSIVVHSFLCRSLYMPSICRSREESVSIV